jgi:uncharacterized protein YecE (DUF72 family)
MAGQFFGGTSGLQITVPKRDFPPDQAHLSRLGFYALHENSLEINSSFYKLPHATTLQRWTTEVPVNFRFTFKLWKEVTHQKNLIFKTQDVQQFLAVLPETNKGSLLIQFPPSLQSAAKPQLKELLQLLANHDWPAAVEFRHNSWYTDSTYELLNSFDAAMVIQDMPKSATPIELTSDGLVYLRFHGPSGNYKGSYNDSFLYEYAMYIDEWLGEGKTVYCYFNNTAGAALENLNFLRRCLEN